MFEHIIVVLLTVVGLLSIGGMTAIGLTITPRMYEQMWAMIEQQQARRQQAQ